MAEEKKVDLSAFDGISDRVARAKAKAEAMRAAKAGGGTEGGTPSSPEPASPAETPVSQTASPEAPPVPDTPPQSEAGSTDLSSLDAITDRVARAKAKAEAMRAAKAAGGKSPTPPAPKGAAKPGREPSVSAEATAAKKAQAKARAQPTPPQDARPASGGDGTTFCPGVTIRRDGKLARIISTKYENVLLVYQDNPDEKVMTKLYRLEVERQRGKLVFAPAGEFTAVLPHSVGRFGRGLAFFAAAGLTGGFFLASGLLIGPLNLFLTIPVGYVLFAFAHHLTE